jgi:hypothetical protein
MINVLKQEFGNVLFTEIRNVFLVDLLMIEIENVLLI